MVGKRLSFGTGTRRALVAAACLAFLACSGEEPPTQVIVTIDAETGVKTDAQSLRVLVFPKEGRDGALSSQPVFDQAFTVSLVAGGWGRRVAMAPKDGDTSRWFSLVARAVDGTAGQGQLVAQARLITGYVKGRVVEVRLVLTDACRGVECPNPTETCAGGACVDATLILPGTDPDSGTVDGGDDSEIIDTGPPVACTEASQCDDAVACTIDTCEDGFCVRSPDSTQCDDGNDCTDDQCHVLRGCQNPPNQDPCDDGIYCNGGDNCGDGSCSGHAGDPCASPTTCDEGAGTCTGCVTDDHCPGESVCDDGDCVCPASSEADCGDGADNDCDGQTDCTDSDCREQACGSSGFCLRSACCDNGVVELEEETCDDDEDNDCDGKTDCQDEDCNAQACGNEGLICSGFRCTCPGLPVESSCVNQVDDNCNGLIDCEEGVCNGQACDAHGSTCNGTVCECPTGPENCLDGVDNDCDGDADCQDSDCTGDRCSQTNGRLICRDNVCDCPEDGPETNCTDRFDNDCNGLTDCEDAACRSEICGMSGTTTWACNPSCPSSNCVGGCCPTGEALNSFACRDGEDNDCDGRVDCRDSDCAGVFGGRGENCFEPGDEDCDGLPDCNDPECCFNTECQFYPACR